MKLLIVTQVLDENDPVLGFFCRWVEEFAKHVEHVHVIAFRAGEYHLPANVSVHSLGKERGVGKLSRTLAYLSLVFSLRKEYTHVFAHMSPEYVIAAAWLWRIFGKKIGLWYNHTHNGQRLRLASGLSDVVFHTSPYAASARLRNARRMPAGIDTNVFTPQAVTKKPESVYFQGRVAAAKRVGIICEALRLVRKTRAHATLAVVGPDEIPYAERVKNTFGDLMAARALFFFGPKKNTETPALYSAARVSVNLTDAGNYDKTVLESAACGTPVIVGSNAFADIVPSEWVVPPEDPYALAEKLNALFSLPEAEYAALAERVREAAGKQSVAVLGETLVEAFRIL